jgi:hypothetical protein
MEVNASVSEKTEPKSSRIFQKLAALISAGATEA